MSTRHKATKRVHKSNSLGRRDFLLTGAALAAGGLLAGIPKARADEEASTGGKAPVPDTPVPVLGKVTEPAREVPIVAEADVVVVGGGPAGTMAAIGAARAGASVIMLERYNHLGGLWTGGLVVYLAPTYGADREGKRQRILYGIEGEIWDRIKEMKMNSGPCTDPEATKYVLDEMTRDAGVKVLYHCWASQVIVKDGVIQAVLLESKSGRVAVKPKIVIDCTGDGDVFAWAGEGFEKINTSIGLVHRLGNVDRVDTTKPGYKKISVGAPSSGIKSVNWVNMSGGTGDALNLFTLSEKQQSHRIAIWKRVQEIRATPGYEEVYLLETAPQLGVRLARVLDGQYKMMLEESLNFKQYDDAIGISGGWTDHKLNGKTYPRDKRPMWQIPYRSLVPKKTKNLLVAGRCISCEKTLTQDTRVIGTCMITGHGAGVAAAVAIKKGAAVQDNDIAAIRKTLLEEKAFLG